MLHCGDGHHALMRIEEMASGLIGLHLACILHEHARDNLKAVRDTMLKFPKQDRSLLQHVVFESGGYARTGDIGYRHQKQDILLVTVIELLGIENQTAVFAPRPAKVDLILIRS